METACCREGWFSPCLFWTTQQCLRPFYVPSLADAFSWTSYSALDGKHVGTTATQHSGCFKAQFWDSVVLSSNTHHLTATKKGIQTQLQKMPHPGINGAIGETGPT